MPKTRAKIETFAKVFMAGATYAKVFMAGETFAIILFVKQ